MAGIVAYGAYIPRYRLGKETAGWGLPSEKAVANYDEDSITMAAAAGIDCITGLDRNDVDALYFATTTSPYIEKQGASIVAAAVDLRRDIVTSDVANSLRAGTLALRTALDAVEAGTAMQAMVTAADCRVGPPGGELDQSSGDGAAALLIGHSGIIANVIGSHSATHEMLDNWRAEGDRLVRTWEDRWVYDTGYLKIVPEVVAALLKKAQLTPKDIARVALFGPAPRRHGEVAARMGFASNQVQDALFGKVGSTGAAHALMVLVAALEEAKPGDKILVASYGDGADAYLLEVTSEISKLPPRRGIKRHLEAKRIRRAVGPRGGVVQAAEGAPPSISALLRDIEDIDRLRGVKCKSCGLVQYPPQRVCSRCHAKDQWDTVRLSDKMGKIFTFSLDYVAPGPDGPNAIAVVNFDGGGRGIFQVTDREIADVKCEAPIEMSFRRLRSSGGVHLYWWKAIPVRV